MPVPQNVEDNVVEVKDDIEDKPQKPATPKWQKQEDIFPIVMDLIKLYPEILSQIRPNKIGYISFSKKKSTIQAKIYGLKPMFAFFSNVDYILTVHFENWVMIEKSAKYLLILHELMHIPEQGFDEGSKDYRKCLKHDVQDFSYLLQRYGIHGEDADKILKAKEAKDKENE
jgi:predicted metallopeptidase